MINLFSIDSLSMDRCSSGRLRPVVPCGVVAEDDDVEAEVDDEGLEDGPGMAI